jgi:hypothetical protein
MDDHLAALTTQKAITFTITAEECTQNVSFSRDDANVSTFITVYGAQAMTGAQYPSFGVLDARGVFQDGVATANYTPDVTVQHFGVRGTQFTFMFFALSKSNPLTQKMYKLIQILHNQLDVMTITVKGRAFYRAGTRVFVNVGFARQSVSNAYWYICSVQQSWAMGSGWTTRLTCRFPQSS